MLLAIVAVAVVVATAALGPGVLRQFGYALRVTRPAIELVPITAQGAPFDADRELLQYAFTGPLPEDRRLLSPPIRRIEELAAALRSISPPYAYLFAAGEELRVEDRRPLGEDSVVVPYVLRNWRSSAYAYVSRRQGGGASCAALIIPGSGADQSSLILRGAGYHGTIVRSLVSTCDVYVQVKPNEDYRVIHDGSGKLGNDFLYADISMHGGAYSATALIEAIALTRDLQRTYPTIGLVGLSQGGSAAFLVSLETRPGFAVVASGWSVLDRDVYWASEEQIVVPGLFERWSLPRIDAALAASRTAYFLSYGRREVGTYRIEAETSWTCAALAAVLAERLTCDIHDGGHEFPERAIVDFVQQHVPGQ